MSDENKEPMMSPADLGPGRFDAAGHAYWQEVAGEAGWGIDTPKPMRAWADLRHGAAAEVSMETHELAWAMWKVGARRAARALASVLEAVLPAGMDQRLAAVIGLLHSGDWRGVGRMAVEAEEASVQVATVAQDATKVAREAEEMLKAARVMRRGVAGVAGEWKVEARAALAKAERTEQIAAEAKKASQAAAAARAGARAAAAEVGWPGEAAMFAALAVERAVACRPDIDLRAILLDAWEAG